MPVDETPLSVKDTLANQKKRGELEGHVDGLRRGQEVVTGSKPGQTIAEEMTVGMRGGSLPDDPAARSKALKGLADLVKYDDTAKEDVLKLANAGQDLTDPQMWNLVAGNARFMTNIQPGLTVNKILPDETFDNVLKHKQTWVNKDPVSGNVTASSTQLGGSVADERYYQRLTGEQAIANFGLDYGGYKAGTMQSDKINPSTGKHSSYVADARPDEQGRTLKGVPNVFYVKVKVPATSLDQVKVPVHPNVDQWAREKLKEVEAALADGPTLKTLAKQAGGTEDEMRAKLLERKATLETFTKNSKVDQGMLTTVTQDGADWVKNREDPLTNLGMTKPSNRLQTDFETINQEYHIGTRFNIPEGSELFLKDATGKDRKVGELVMNNGRVEFGKLDTTLINRKLQENESFREMEKAKINLKPVENATGQKTPKGPSEIQQTKAGLKTPEPTVKSGPEGPGEIEQAMAKLKKPGNTAVKSDAQGPTEIEQARAKLKPTVREQMGKSSSPKPKVEGIGHKSHGV